MRALHLILCVALVGSLVQGCTQPKPEFHFGLGGAILPPNEAMKLAGQCSRPSPSPVTGAWVPTHDQIADLEAGLPRYFRHEAESRPVRPVKNDKDADLLLSKYFRQYAGLIVGGRIIVYVNAIHVLAQRDEPNGPTWLTQADLFCDGGMITFGVEFDPQTRTLDHFAFNGVF